MVSKYFKIGEPFKSINFDQSSAQALAENLTRSSEGLHRINYSINSIKVAFPFLKHPYPLEPQSYALSDVSINDIPSQEALREKYPQGVALEPRLFRLTGENIDLVIVQQDSVKEYSESGWFIYQEEKVYRKKRFKVDENYLAGSISLKDEFLTTERKLIVCSQLETIIREHSNVIRDEAAAEIYDAVKTSSELKPILL